MKAADSAELAPERPSSRVRRLNRLLTIGARRHGPVLVLIGAGFVTRLFLAGWNSYWYDEILSVSTYGISQDSALDAARFLAQQSIHPPLYQMTLFQWMEVFGDSETATRSLSNLYVAGATVFTYLFVGRFASRSVAFAAAAIFSIMYVPTYFALETRSYAQTIFLVCLSGYLLLRVLGAYSERDRGTTLWRSPGLLLLTLCNAALLLTHYYNFFFWTAQGIFVLAYVLRHRRVGDWVIKLSSLAGSYVVQVVIFAGIWGSTLLTQFRSSSESYRVDGELVSPLSILVDDVLTPNFRSPRPVLWLMAAIVTGLALRALWRVTRSGRSPASAWHSWWLLYLLAALIGPIVVGTAAFDVAGVARYNERYFLFSAPAIAPLLAVTISEVVASARTRLSISKSSDSRGSLFALTVFVVAVLWVVPGGHAAAVQAKHDWRGVVSDVIQVVQSDDANSYVIVEAGHRTEPMSNYYFERLAEGIRAEYALTSAEEQVGTFRALGESRRSQIERHDRLLVVFLHSRTSANHFPNALSQLEERYDELHRQLRFGRGYVLFELG